MRKLQNHPPTIHVQRQDQFKDLLNLLANIFNSTLPEDMTQTIIKYQIKSLLVSRTCQVFSFNRIITLRQSFNLLQSSSVPLLI